jgi:hypothetical protein
MKSTSVIVLALLGGSTSAQVLDDGRPELHRKAQALPDVALANVVEAVEAAWAAQTQRWQAPLLIAIAWGESRFIASTVTGIACGPMQTIAYTRTACRSMQNMLAGFKAGVSELEEWDRDRRTHHDLKLILLAYACGNSAFNGTCKKRAWPGWVLKRARALGFVESVRPLRYNSVM